MPHATKIATCCYCGTRAALVLTGKERHELSCSACGAPLHEMKMLRTDRSGDRELAPRPIKTSGKKTKNRKQKPKKKRKSLLSKVFDEVFDVIEDVLD